jgi:branched-chain amino acid transport system permease protein
VTYIDPTSFSLRESIFLVTLLMLAGGGNVKGPLVGAVVMLTLPEVLRFVGLPDAVAANVREILYGGLLAGLMYWRPQGLAGERLP